MNPKSPLLPASAGRRASGGRRSSPPENTGTRPRVAGRRGGSPASHDTRRRQRRCAESPTRGGRRAKCEPRVDGISNTVHPWVLLSALVRSRSCKLCLGRDLVVLASRLAARGWRCIGRLDCLRPVARRRMSADRRRRRPRRFIVEEKRVPLALGKAFVALRSGEGNGQPVAGFGGPEMLAVSGEPRRRLHRRHPAASCSKPPATQGHGGRWIESVIG